MHDAEKVPTQLSRTLQDPLPTRIMAGLLPVHPHLGKLPLSAFPVHMCLYVCVHTCVYVMYVCACVCVCGHLTSKDNRPVKSEAVSHLPLQGLSAGGRPVALNGKIGSGRQ